MSKSRRMTTADLIRAVLRDKLTTVGTSIPGHVTAFDPATQLAQLQIGIRTAAGGQLPIIIECPVMFSGGAQFVCEHQVDPGDEGIIIFSQRCLDAWLETGSTDGAAEQPVARMHDFNDAYFIPGLRPKPRAIPSMANNGIALRNMDGSKYIWLKNDGDVDISAGTVTISGTLKADTIEADTSLKAAGAEVVAHVHGGNNYDTHNTLPLTQAP